jgi:hypothetical protein
MKVLISPLGLSPGAVSGLYYALQRERGVKVDKVITIGTQDPKLRGGKRVLEDVFGREKVDYDHHSIPFPHLRWDGAVRAFCKEVAATLASAQEHEVYLGISAGYASMGALALLVARQNRSVDAVYHLWVDDEMQQMGHIDRFATLAPEDQEQVLRSLGGFLTVIPIKEADQRLQWLTEPSDEYDEQGRQMELKNLRETRLFYVRSCSELEKRIAMHGPGEAPLILLNQFQAAQEALHAIEARLAELGGD